MISEQTQIHLIKSIITLKKVSITVRFPCSISFALKHQTNIVDHKAVYELLKGQCNINKAIQIQLEIPFFRGRYDDRKVSLLIYMVSSNGKIPAGTVTINPTQKLIMDKRMPMQKCPDKNAFVVYTESFERIKTVRSNTERGRLSNLASSTISGYHQLRRSSTHQTTSSLQKQTEDSKAVEVTAISPRNQMERSDIKMVDSKELKQSMIASSSEKKVNVHMNRPPRLRLDVLPRKSSFENLEKGQESKRSRVGSEAGGFEQWEVQAQKSRIMKLEQQKASYIKQISRLRGSMVRVQSEERIQLEDEINRVKDEKDSLKDELQQLRDRSRHHQKKQQQSNSLMKELRDQLDKKKSKIFQLDSSKHQIQGQLSQKDKLINTLQSQKKKLQEALQQEKSVQSSIQKRVELKQNSYKDQLKKINQKLTQTDAERQKAIFDYSNLLNQVQASEKRHQTHLREKDRAITEEKLKMNKRNEQLAAENAQLNEKIAQNYSMLRDYDYFKKKYSQEEKDYQQKIKNLKETNESFQIEIKQLKQQFKGLNVQFLRVEETLNNERNSFKRKTMDLNQQLNSYKQKLQKVQSINMVNQSSIKDLELKLQKQTKQKNATNAKLEELIKIQQKLTLQQENKQKLVQTLSVQNINHNQKLNDFKNRFDSQRKKFQVMQAKYQQQVKYLINAKDYLENEIEEMKWQLQKQSQKYEVLSIKHREVGDKVMELSQKNISFEQQVISLQQEINQKNQQITVLQGKIISYEYLIKRCQQNQSNGQAQLSILDGKCNNYEQQIISLKEKKLSNETFYKQSAQNLQGIADTLKNKLRQKQIQHQTTIKELQNAKSMLNRQHNQLTMQNNEINEFKQAIKTIKDDYSSIVYKYDSIREESQQAKRRLSMNQQAITQSSQQLATSVQTCQRIKMEFEEYKTSNARCLQQLFAFISREEPGQNNQISILHSLPDERLSQLQIHSIRKHQAIRKKLEDETSQLRNTTQYLQSQLVKLQSYIQKIEEQHISHLKRSQDELASLQQQKNKCIAQLQSKLDELTACSQELKNQIDYYNAEVIKYEETITNLTEQVQSKRSKDSQLNTQIHKLEQQLFGIKEKQVKEKLLFTSQASQLKQILVLQRQHNLQIINGLRAEVKDKEKQLSQKVEDIKRWSLNQSQLKILLNKAAEESRELNKKIEEEKKGKVILQRHLKDKEKLLRELQEQIGVYRKRQDQLKQVQIAKEQELNHIKSEYQSLWSRFAQLKQQERVKSGSYQESEKKQRQRRQKIEAVRAKLEQQNKQVREKCVRLQSQNQFYKFFKAQSTKKLEQLQKAKEQSFKELIKCKESTLRYEKEIGNYESKYYKLEMQIQTISKQRIILQESNNKMKENLFENQEKINALYHTIAELQSRDKEIKRLQEANKFIQDRNEQKLVDIKSQTGKLIEQSNKKSLRISQLEQQLEDYANQLNLEKEKWQEQLDNEKNIYQLKLQTLDQNISALHNELQFQKQQSVKEVQGANGIIQQLNEVIRQKEELLQYKSEVISEQTVRLEELNMQLAECVAKWEKEKETYMPNDSKMTELRDEITRMNAFISDLDGRNKQLLEINKRKMQKSVENKPLITETLKELYVLMQKNKNKILSRCHNEKEREAVMGDFKALQEKLDLTLKSPQIVTVKQ